MRSLVALEVGELRTLTCPWCGRTPPRGSAGFKVVRDKEVIGAIVVAPPDPDRDLCPPAAAVVSQLWVRPADVGEHVGAQLVQRQCAQLAARDVRFLVAYGTAGLPDCAHLPAGWLEAVGFAEHVGGIQWRLDLGRTLPLAHRSRRLAAAFARALRPSDDQRPAPAGRSGAAPSGAQRWSSGR